MKLKKFEQKDRHGNMFSIEFDTSVPEMNEIPEHPGQPKGTDTVPAWLTPGEFVVNAEAMRNPVNAKVVREINSEGRTVQQAQGGSIPTYQSDGGWITDELLDNLRFIESGDNHSARSPKGALGAYQWMPDAAASPGFGVEPFNASTISEADMREKTREYLQKLQAAHPEMDKVDVLRAYNWGIGNVRKMYRPDEEGATLGMGAVPKEAQDYPYKVLAKTHEAAMPVSSPVPRPKGNEYTEYQPDIPKVILPEEPGFLDTIGDYVSGIGNMLRGYTSDEERIPDPNQGALDRAARYYAAGDLVNEPSYFEAIDKLKAKGYTGDQIAAIFRGEDVPKIEEPADVPPKPGIVKSINKFGKAQDYQKVEDEYYRRKSDGTLAADPATGLVAANLKNTESPIVGPAVPRIGGAQAFTNPETIAYGKGSGQFLDDGVGRAAQANLGKKFLDPQSNVVYHVSETTGLLLDSYGHPAPANVQAEFNKKQAGLLNEETAVPGLDTVPYNETSEALTTKAETLQKKAQDEVDKTGQVSDETATGLAQTKGQVTQVSKFETDAATLAEEERRQQAQLNKDTLMADYNKAKAIAEGSGITGFPSFDEWKQRQGIDKDTDTGEKDTTTAAQAGVQSDVLTAITNDIQSIDDGSASGTTGSQAETAVKQAGDGGQQKVEQSESFLAGIFGDLFNADEIKRMAILYAGSRLLGGSHGGSLNWAAKQYLTRVDAIAADHNATVKKLIEEGEYSPKSINEYKKTKDASVLVKLGVAPVPSGDKQMWYSPEGKRVQAEKFKVGDGYIWSADGGKTAIPASFHQEAERVRGTDKFNDRIRAEVPLLKDTIKELSIAAGDVTPGDSERGIKRTQRTNITPTDAALEAAQWAAKNGIDTAQMATYVDQAYRMAIAQSGGEDNVKPESLLPYLNQLKLRQDTGVSELFDIVTKDGLPTAMDAVKIEQLSRQFLQRAGGQGSISEGRNRDAVNLFWTKAAEIWAQKTKDNPDIVAEYQRKAGVGETAFYAYAKEQLNLPMK